MVSSSPSVSASPHTPTPTPGPSTSQPTSASASAKPDDKEREKDAKKKKAASTPHNVFANDGSFLERFKKTKQDGDDEKKKREEALNRKKAMEDRFRNRGKRRLATSASASPGAEGELAKRARKDDEDPEVSAYVREVRKLERSSLKDVGSGVRPLVK